jgi:hypothetical protein
MRALVLSSFVVLFGAACGGSSTPPVAAPAAASVAASAAEPKAPADRPPTLTAATCEKVLDHLIAVMKREFHGAVRACAPETRAKMGKIIDDGLRDSRSETIATCEKEAAAGKILDTAEYECFMAGETIASWTACRFSNVGSFGSFDDELAAATQKLRDTCERPDAAAAP